MLNIFKKKKNQAIDGINIYIFLGQEHQPNFFIFLNLTF